MNEIIISWPKPVSDARTIIPVFVPFLGCIKKCVFCAQEIQTGTTRTNLTSLEKMLSQHLEKLHERAKLGLTACELGFYGGTFTNIDEDSWQMCLWMAKKAMSKGLITGFRCSTRPDYLRDKRLEELKESGCNVIELGIQSFSDRALEISGRAYDRGTAINACRKVVEKHFGLGIQLMPGMPGSVAGDFLSDMKLALNIDASFLRLYPCLVIRGTRLALLWQKGKFIPWNMEKTLYVLAKAWLMASFAGIKIIRMGLAPEFDLESAILAGPFHRCLGSRIMGRALLMLVAKQLRELSRDPVILSLPVYMQGCYLGWQKELAERWLKLGITKTNIEWNNDNQIRIVTKKICG